VSALLLDDAHKPATPLTNGAINETPCYKTQSSVATQLRCDGIANDISVSTNFLLILTVRKFGNRLLFADVKAYKAAPFWSTLYVVRDSLVTAAVAAVAARVSLKARCVPGADTTSD